LPDLVLGMDEKNQIHVKKRFGASSIALSRIIAPITAPITASMNKTLDRRVFEQAFQNCSLQKNGERFLENFKVNLKKLNPSFQHGDYGVNSFKKFVQVRLDITYGDTSRDD
jgi:hypothetical protein